MTDLIEAEGRSLRRALLRSSAGLAILGVAAVIALAGILLCLWAGYQYLQTLWGPILTSLAVGIFMLVLSGVLIWIVIRLNR